MRAPRRRLGEEQRVRTTRARSEHAHCRERLLRPAAVALHRRSHRRVAVDLADAGGDGEVAAILAGEHVARHDGEVLLVHEVPLEGGAEAARARLVERKAKAARRVAVEAMRRVNVVANVRDGAVDHRAARQALCWTHLIAGRLVDDENVRVAVEHPDRHRGVGGQRQRTHRGVEQPERALARPACTPRHRVDVFNSRALQAEQRVERRPLLAVVSRT